MIPTGHTLVFSWPKSPFLFPFIPVPMLFPVTLALQSYTSHAFKTPFRTTNLYSKLSFFQHTCHLSYNIPIISLMLNAHSYLSLCSSRPLPCFHTSYILLNSHYPFYPAALLDPGHSPFWPYFPYLSPYLERVFHCPLPRSFRSNLPPHPCWKKQKSEQESSPLPFPLARPFRSNPVNPSPFMSSVTSL
jgi:hypothetical protein